MNAESTTISPSPSRVPLIAFHLPQFHPIPENDEWWGKGFTEWHNVVRAKPLWRGHEQPNLPADLGFYDLRLPEVRHAQAELARAYGVSGFCYYHYWFNGRRVLERPVNEILKSGEPDFPFLLCWANENWTRAWDGMEREQLLTQAYGHDDDVAHIRSLLPAFADPRYIRIDGRPAFLVYRAVRLPDPVRTTDLWREEVRRAGLPELLLLRVESFADEQTDPRKLGFDAAVEFMPNHASQGRRLSGRRRYHLLQKLGLIGGYPSTTSVYDYSAHVAAALASPEPGYERYRCVMPRWDNAARRPHGGVAFVGSTPKMYGGWLQEIATREMARARVDLRERPIFVNAWNEWAEGAYLEPDQRYGNAYLKATQDALAAAGVAPPTL